MKYLGIDYGTKRIGIAVSDENGEFAFPKMIVGSDEAVKTIAELCEQEHIEAIVIGKSVASNGMDNDITLQAESFRAKISLHINVPVYFQQEGFSTMEAHRYQVAAGNRDDSAAAIILQRYLDTTQPPLKLWRGKVKLKNNYMEEDKKEITEEYITIEDFKKIKAKIGKVLVAEAVPDSDKLIRFELDFGEEQPRQILSAIREWYPEPEKLVGTMMLFVINLAPRTIRGFESNGMLMAVDGTDGAPVFLVPQKEVLPGTTVR